MKEKERGKRREKILKKSWRSRRTRFRGEHDLKEVKEKSWRSHGEVGEHGFLLFGRSGVPVFL